MHSGEPLSLGLVLNTMLRVKVGESSNPERTRASSAQVRRGCGELLWHIRVTVAIQLRQLPTWLGLSWQLLRQPLWQEGAESMWVEEALLREGQASSH